MTRAQNSKTLTGLISVGGGRKRGSVYRLSGPELRVKIKKDNTDTYLKLSVENLVEHDTCSEKSNLRASVELILIDRSNGK